jgi:hypothetical protein
LKKDGPTFLSESENLTMAENRSISLYCSMEQHPQTRIIWKNLKTNKTVSMSLIENIVDSIDRQTSILKFDKLTRKDLGTYVCFAKGFQETQLKFDILVKCKIYIF